jgi:hypothetical protein
MPSNIIQKFTLEGVMTRKIQRLPCCFFQKYYSLWTQLSPDNCFIFWFFFSISKSLCGTGEYGSEDVVAEKKQELLRQKEKEQQ